nr:hypothetical protein [Paracoccaceae bacterium]
MTSAATSPAEILSRYDALIRDGGPIRQRLAAESLDVPEAALVFAKTLRGDAKPLLATGAPGFGQILVEMPKVGVVMALTRNASCVHEKYGVFEDVTADGPMGMVVGRDIDLRLFFNHWRHGFLVTEDTASGRRESLQFFDAAGDAVHKIYKTDKTDATAFAGIAKQFSSEVSAVCFEPDARKAPPPLRPDAEIDADGLRQTWLGLQHTHDFFMM